MIEDLAEGWEALEEALPAYKEAEQFAQGRAGEIFANQRMRIALQNVSRKYRFNVCETVIKSLMAKVKLRSIAVGDQPEATKWLREQYELNQMVTYWPHLFELAGTYGDAYLMTWDEFGSDGEATGNLVYTVLDPKHCRLLYDPENERVPRFGIRRWTVKRAGEELKRWRVDLLYGSRIEHWVSQPGVKAGENKGFSPEDWERVTDPEDEMAEETENPYGVVPLQHFRTDLVYGKPVHRNAYGPQNALTKMLVSQVTTSDSQTFRERWRLLEEGGELDNASDDPIWDDDADASETDLKLTDTSASGPGAEHIFSGTKAVGEFAVTDPQAFLGPAEFYMRLAAQFTRSPFHYFDPSGDVPSGESLKTADAPLTEKANAWKEQHLESALIQHARLSLLMGGKGDAKDKPILVSWEPSETATTKDEWETVKLKQDLGVPQGQTLVEAGYEAETVEEWLNQDAEAMDTFRRVDLIKVVGEAVAGLGSGVALGVVTKEQAKAIVDRILGAAAPESNSQDVT